MDVTWRLYKNQMQNHTFNEQHMYTVTLDNMLLPVALQILAILLLLTD